MFLCLVRGVTADELLLLKFSWAEISASLYEQIVRGLCNVNKEVISVGATSRCLCYRIYVPTHPLKRYPTPCFNIWHRIPLISFSLAMAQSYRWCLAGSICPGPGEMASKTPVEGSQRSVALSYQSLKHVTFLTA